MPNPQLNKMQLAYAHNLIKEIRHKLEELSNGNIDLLFAYRRKITKELTYDERSKPVVRKKLKRLAWKRQEEECAFCGKQMLLRGSHLDRKYAPKGYIESNVRLVHNRCHRRDQAKKNYK